MVGSYPRPRWFHQQLSGRDVRVAFKEVEHEEAFNDAAHAVIRDQEEAGLDIVTDGQMHYDDYVGGIGSFCWYMYERIGGFAPAREEHPSITEESEHNRVNALLTDWGGVVNGGPATHGPIRLVDLYKIASKYTDKPIKVSVGAGPVNLAWHVYFQHYKDPQELCYALAPIFNAEMKALAEAGAHVPPARGSRRVAAALHRRRERLHVDQGRDRQVLRGRRREDRLALLLRQRVGERHPQRQLPRWLPDGAAVLLGHARDRRVRPRLREPRDGRHRVHGEPAGGQGACRSACSTSAR